MALFYFNCSAAADSKHSIASDRCVIQLVTSGTWFDCLVCNSTDPFENADNWHVFEKVSTKCINDSNSRTDIGDMQFMRELMLHEYVMCFYEATQSKHMRNFTRQARTRARFGWTFERANVCNSAN